MALFSQFKSLFQLPGQQKKTAESAAQSQAIQQRLAATQPTIPPAVLPQVQPAALPVAPVFGPAIVPPKPIPPTAESAPVDSPQIQAIQGALSGLGKQAEELQAGLASLKAQQISEAPLRKAEEAIIAAQQITPEERMTEQQLSNLITSRELGLQAVSEKPIAMPFIVGQQQAIERRAAVQTMPLQARLAQLQSKRMSSLDVGKSQLEIEKGRQIRAEKIKKEARPDETEISEFVNAEGNRIVVFKNNKTGKLRQEIVGKEKIGIAGKTVGDKITPTTKANIQTTLFNVGIPISVSTDKGELNKSYYDKAISAGLAPVIINGIWQNIITGNTFEEIRQGIKSQGGDPAILDIFIPILQNKTKGEIENPFD